MTPTLFQRYDSMATRMTHDEMGALLEMTIQAITSPVDDDIDILHGQFDMVERRILDDVLHGRSLPR